MSDVTLVEDGGTKAPAAPPAKAAPPEKAAPAVKATPPIKGKEAPPETPKAPATLTEVADALDADEKAVVASWPDDWRERLAGNDETALKQLKRFNDISGLWKKLVNQDKVIRETRKTPGRPGKDATPEDIAEYRKASNVPETAEGYFDVLNLADNKLLGDNDRPIFDDFAKAMHAVHAPPEYVKTGVDWYLARMEKLASEQAEKDDALRVEARDTLRDEWGPADFKRNVNAAQTLFKDVPEEIRLGILHARMPDGRLVGDHPAVIKLFADIAVRANPAATIVTPAGTDPGKTIDEEIKGIEKTMRTDRRAYDKDNNMQARYRELLDARDRLKKSRAA